MSIVLSHISAALIWLSPEASFYTLRRTINTPPLLSERDTPSNLTNSTHILIPSNARIPRQFEGAVIHYQHRKLPSGSIVENSIDSTRFAVCPELSFLQIADSCDFLTTVRYGSELCSQFVRTGYSGEPLAERTPLTSPSKLKRYLDESKGANGIDQARRALKYVVAEARSPREIEFALMMFLHRKDQGFGIPQAPLNERIYLEKRYAHLDHRKYFECDFLWREAKLVVEYDSEFAHSTRQSRERDASKRNALSVLGYTILTVTTGQLETFQGTITLAKTISKHLHIRFRPLTHQQEQASYRLWLRLFSNSDPSFWLPLGEISKTAKKNRVDLRKSL